MALNLVGWHVVLDSDKADELSAFYERLFGWTRFQDEEYTVNLDYHLAVTVCSGLKDIFKQGGRTNV